MVSPPLLRWISLALPLACTPLACSDSAPFATAAESSAADRAALGTIARHPYRDVCAHEAEPGVLRCFAKIRADDQGHLANFDAPNGFTPSDLRAAYGVPASGTFDDMIAIVAAYDNPNAEADLAVYRSTFGLPPCTTGNGCFIKLNQTGTASPLPAANTAWAREIALDIDMVSAICPSCRILLVEATTGSTANLGTAVNTAVRLGAAVVSNSYGGLETDAAPTHDTKYFNHTGVAIFAAAGDSGYQFGTAYPASGANVIGVGGTSLARSTSARGWAEAVWGSETGSRGTGSGCSSYVARPPWVTAADSPNCAKKTVADVSAVADPDTGVAVYNTYVDPGGESGWNVYGGTSAAAPIVAAIFVVAGKSGSNGSFIWNRRAAFHDVIHGTNSNGAPAEGPPCAAGGNNLCNAVAGFDAPTGWGTPNASAVLAAAAVDAGPRPDAGPDPFRDAGIFADAGPKDGGLPIADSGSDPDDNDATALAGGGFSCTIAAGEPRKGITPALAGLAVLPALLVLLRLRRGKRPPSAKGRSRRWSGQGTPARGRSALR